MDSLIFDRTANSFYNVSDVNRVEEWTEVLANRLLNLGYAVTIKPKKVWSMGDIVDNVQLDRIRANVNALQDGYFAIPEWREILFGNRFNYAQADTLEWDLQQCYNWLEQMVGVFVPCGSYQSGAALYLPSEVYYYVTVFIPFQTSKMVYNGRVQSPVWSSLNGIDIVNEAAVSDAGEYKTIFKPKPNHKWDDGTTGEKTVNWTIEKAVGSLSVKPSAVALTKENPSAEITVDYVGDGELQIVTTSPDVIAVLSGNKITITAKANSEATVSIGVANSKNYTTPDSVFCSVSATGFYVDTHTLLLLHGESIEDSSQYKVPLDNQGVEVSTAQSKFGGKSLYFNGLNSSIKVPGYVFDGDFTVDWWEYLPGYISNYGNVFCFYETPSHYVLCAYNPKNKIEMWGVTPSGPDNISGVNVASQIVGQWVHRAFVRKNGILSHYENGTKVWGAKFANKIENLSGVFTIGRDVNGTQIWKGYIDEFRVSDVARWVADFTPPSEPYDVYKEQPKDQDTLLLLHGESVEDSSAYKVPLTNQGVTVSTAQSKFGGKSLYFDGENHVVKFPSQYCEFKNRDFTIDFWSLAETATGCFFSTLLGSGLGFMFGNAGKSILGTSKGGGWNVIQWPDVMSVEIGNWTHWAFVRKENTAYLFKNGKQIKFGSMVGSLQVDRSKVSAIGINAGQNQPYKGYLDEFRISNIARWTSNFVPPTSPYN